MTNKEKKIVYQQGVTARESGYERISPYQNCKSEVYWLAGFDNKSLEAV